MDIDWRESIMRKYSVVKGVEPLGDLFCISIDPAVSLRDVRSVVRSLEKMGLSFDTFTDHKLYMRRSGQWT